MNSNAKSADKEIISILRRLAAVCSNAPGKDGLSVYCDVLRDIEPSTLSLVVDRYVSENEEPFFPMPAKLRRLAMEATEGSVPGWETAWARILDGAKIFDRFDERKALAAREHIGPVLMGFVRMLGGWEAIQVSDASVMASNFRNAWTSQKTNHETQRALPEHLRPKTALIGEQQHARIE